MIGHEILYDQSRIYFFFNVLECYYLFVGYNKKNTGQDTAVFEKVDGIDCLNPIAMA
jgi:hypothetical protein